MVPFSYGNQQVHFGTLHDQGLEQINLQVNHPNAYKKVISTNQFRFCVLIIVEDPRCEGNSAG